jgi:hypothetical protein
MPNFSREVDISEYVDVDVYISVDDFYDEMNDTEKKKMLNLLTEDGFIISDAESHINWEFVDAINKLNTNYFSLTNEEIDTIIRLSKRF